MNRTGIFESLLSAIAGSTVTVPNLEAQIASICGDIFGSTELETKREQYIRHNGTPAKFSQSQNSPKWLL
ncbi:MAG: hypothetical protein IPG22_05865 [Acidobacteria bacterium]|nr:hypothetical protein [Acidobacteriota bacterium]